MLGVKWGGYLGIVERFSEKPSRKARYASVGDAGCVPCKRSGVRRQRQHQA